MTNKELIEKYPWLTPSNRFSGKWITDCIGEDGEEGFWPGEPTKHPEYNYEFTELDMMPDGWRKQFGEQMCEEIQQELMTWTPDKYKNFRIFDIKEKYGELRFYVNMESIKLHKIIRKYMDLSRKTCIVCGEPACWMSKGWISPYCKECAEEEYNHHNNLYSEQSDWYEYYTEIKEEES